MQWKRDAICRRQRKRGMTVNKRERKFPGTGLITILMVFMLLCLITFAVLTLSSARADLRYSEQTAERAKNYYAAELRASQRLKEIDEELQETYNKKEENAREQICFTETIDETSMLEVKLQLCDGKEDDRKRYRIESWKTVSNAEWNPDETLPVMQKTE